MSRIPERKVQAIVNILIKSGCRQRMIQLHCYLSDHIRKCVDPPCDLFLYIIIYVYVHFSMPMNGCDGLIHHTHVVHKNHVFKYRLCISFIADDWGDRWVIHSSNEPGINMYVPVFLFLICQNHDNLAMSRSRYPILTC